MTRPVLHVLSFSGGKDSTAMLLHARDLADRHPSLQPQPWILFADTGHEHPDTYAYVSEVAHRTGWRIGTVRADFAADLARKRAYVDTRWRAEGVPDAICDRAMALLAPTGVPFLDLCLWKGRFPSTRSRFCSEELKHGPVFETHLLALHLEFQVVSWQGVRADESPARAALPLLNRGDHPRQWVWRPLLRWSARDVFAIHRRHGLRPNPLYTQGMGRVGCMPCIHARKAEIAEIARRWPEEIARVAEWERLVSAASKRGRSTLFAADKTPGPHQTNHTLPMPDINAVVRWSRTKRGGKAADPEWTEPPALCSSLYGLCE